MVTTTPQKEIIFTPLAPKPVGTYSQAVKFGNLVFISGQISINPETNEIENQNFEMEANRVMSNLKAVVLASGSSMEKVLKVTIFLKNINDFAKLNAIYSDFFAEPYPARAVVEVNNLPKNVTIEIEAVASI